MRLRASLAYLILLWTASIPSWAGSVIPVHLSGLDQLRLDVEAWAPSSSPSRLRAFEDKALAMAVEALKGAGIKIDDKAPATLRVKVSTERIHSTEQAPDRIAAVLLVSLSEPMTLVRNPELQISDGGDGVDWLEYRLIVDPVVDFEADLESEFGFLLDTFVGDLKSARQLRPIKGH
jgi:hypothetical protein